MKQSLGLAQASFAETVENMRKLAHVPVTRSAAEQIVRNLLRPTKPAPVTDSAAFIAKLVQPAESRAPRGEADILRLFSGEAKGSHLPGVRGTAWGLLNAVTEYVDHHVTAKTDSHRMASAWFNGGDDLKTAAFAKLLTLA